MPLESDTCAPISLPLDCSETDERKGAHMKYKSILITTFAAGLAMAGLGKAQAPVTGQQPAPAVTDPTKPTATNKAAKATSAPTEQQIADAKAKGLVWVNTKTKAYHKEGAMYGKTKHGKFMTEEDAKKEGYREAKEPGAKKGKSGASANPATKTTIAANG